LDTDTFQHETTTARHTDKQYEKGRGGVYEPRAGDRIVPVDTAAAAAMNTTDHL
jgi:hypothetical protein